MKVVINKCYGGFSLSPKACAMMGLDSGHAGRNVRRDDPHLVQIVESLGELANGKYAELKVVEIPDDVEWKIGDYDGMEHVAEKHRAWG